MSPRPPSRRGAVVAAAVLLGLGLVGLAGVQVVERVVAQGTDDEPAGVPASAAGCRADLIEPYITPVLGNHTIQGSPVSYSAAPPAAGVHWPTFLRGAEIRSLYTAADRPAVETLVHSLEHGYTILWYDDTAARSEIDTLRDVADDHPVGEHLIVAPWTAEDGEAFPGGAHVALTHWTGPEDQAGVTRYCERTSGEVVADFRADYPKSDSPEPRGP